VYEAHAVELIWEYKNLQMWSTQGNQHFRRSRHPYKIQKQKGKKGGRENLRLYKLVLLINLNLLWTALLLGYTCMMYVAYCPPHFNNIVLELKFRLQSSSSGDSQAGQQST
jgi:hypothetical protein